VRLTCLAKSLGASFITAVRRLSVVKSFEINWQAV